MSNPWLLLWLEGPLQAWGHDSKFTRRDTLAFPTKSGVLGMILSALGLGGEQKDVLAEFADLQQVVISYGRCDTRSGELIKSNQIPLLRDFQMVGSGYDDGDPWTSLLIPKKSDGSKAVGGGTKMTYRYYLQDACFAVVLEIPTDRVGVISLALQDPTWDVYLGRKNCVPTDFIYRGCFESFDEAITQAQTIATEKLRTEDYRVLDGEHDGEVLTLMDVPVQFGERKRYRDRSVTVVAA